MSKPPAYFAIGAGAPVVLLHSSLSSKSQWKALAERLARRFRVIAVDLCGYGDNPALGRLESFDLDDEVRLVADRLDQLVEPQARIHVVGHSYGGLVALRFAHRSGARIASLSLYEPVAFGMLEIDGAASAEVRAMAESVAALVQSGRRKDASQLFVDFWSGTGSYSALPPQARDAIAQRVDKVPLDFRAASRWPSGPVDLCAIVAPTLLLAGNRGPAVTQHIFNRLTMALRNCRVSRIDSGHMGPITDSSLVNPWIEAFIERCGARAHSSPASHPTIGQESVAVAAD